MGSNKKHKSKKHKSHRSSSSFEDRASASDPDKMKFVLRVPPPPQPPEDSLLVKYSLEDIARGRGMGTSPDPAHHTPAKRSKKSKKKHHHQLNLTAVDALKATGLDDISDDDEDEIEQAPLSIYRPSNGGKKLHHEGIPTTTPTNSTSLRVEIDLGKLSLGKRQSSDDPRPVKEHRLKKSLVLPTEHATPPLSKQSPPLSSSSKKKKRKKKKKHKEQQQSDITLPSTPPKEEPPSEEMEWAGPASPVSVDQAFPSPCEIPSLDESYSTKSFDVPNSSVTSHNRTIDTPQSVASSKPPATVGESPEDITRLAASPASSTASSQRLGTKLPPTALKYFLRHLHSQICRNDPEAVFSEPVTDEIAPGYSAIIKQPMDLQTMAAKIELNEYPSVNEFKEDFIIMCSNAMTYNSPETVYYQMAKKLLNLGLKMIQKEVSVRPDIQHGLIPSSQPLPLSSSASSLVDYTSPYVCKISLSLLPQPNNSLLSDDYGAVIDVGGEVAEPVVDQSHLTQIQVGFDAEEPSEQLPALNGGTGGQEPLSLTQDTREEENLEEESVLSQVDEATKSLKERHSNSVPAELSYLNKGEDGKTLLHILNPHSVSPCPVDLTGLSEKIKAGQSASTVLTSELPVFKATPVSYLMYGPFGSFAPAYDTAFATLTKSDSSLLLSTYGSELGISYANSLQQFVKGCGSFASEMGNAILNSLTNGRHGKFAESVKQKEEKGKPLAKQAASSSADSEGSLEAKGEEKTDMPEERETVNEDSLLTGEKDNLMEHSGVTEMSPGIPEGQSAVEDSMKQTAQLLVDLDSVQQERLAQPPSLDEEGRSKLPPPLDQERELASKITSHLVSVASKVQPSDLVSVSSLQRAMGTQQLPTSLAPKSSSATVISTEAVAAITSVPSL